MTFKVGDVVRLKSGGTLMTIVSIEEASGFYGCAWTNKQGGAEDQGYPGDALELYDPEEDIVPIDFG